MKGSISGYLSLRRMPSGRHVFALSRMRPLAETSGLGDVTVRIDAAIEKGRDALRAEFRWEQARDRQSNARGESVVKDNQIDALISGIQSIVQARTLGDEGDPVVRQAHEVLETVFPRGVAAITQQRFEVQLGIMDTMLEHLHGPHSSHVEALGIHREVDRLARLVESFRTELGIVNEAPIRFDQVREARDELHEHTAAVLVAVLSSLPGFDQPTTRERERLLAPLNDQQERVADARRRQRRPLDVNPETGEELEPSGPLLRDDGEDED